MAYDDKQLDGVFKEHGEEIFEKMTDVLSEYIEGCIVTAVTIYPEEEPPPKPAPPSRDWYVRCEKVPGDGIVCK